MTDGPVISKCLLRFGPYKDNLGKPLYRGMKGWVRPTSPVVNVATGEVTTGATPILISDEGQALIYLAHTDQSALSQGFLYSVRWQAGYGDSPPERTFALPVAVGGTTSYDLLVPSTVYPGVFVPLEPDPDPDPVPVPSIGPVTSYHHYQTSPAASWVIDHNLENSIPDVTLKVDNRLVYTDVEYVSSTRITVIWPTPTTGEAYLTI